MERHKLEAGVRMRRALSGMAAAIVLAVALTGCSYLDDAGGVIDDVQKSLVADQKLSKLTDELRERGDVDKVKETVLAVTATAKFAVLMHEDASPSAIAEVTLRIDDVMRSAELQPFTRELSVKAGNANIRQTDFEQGQIDYAAELAYWGAVRAAVGSEMSLTLGADRAGKFQRILAANADEAVVAMAAHVDALRMLESPNGTDTSWMLPGILGATEWPLPEGKVLTFLAAMAGITNLLDDSAAEEPPGVYVYLPDAIANYAPQFTFVAPKSADSIDAAALWQLGLAMAREALITGLPSMGIAIQTFGHELDEDPYFHVGECLDLVPPTSADRKFVADLVASGVDLPDTAAGHCIGFATP